MMSKRSAEDFDLSVDALANDPEYLQWRDTQEAEWVRDMDRWAADYSMDRLARQATDGLWNTLTGK